MFPSDKVVAIVAFERDLKNAEIMESLMHPVPRVIQYQVTFDPERLSPSGDYIRFGGHGDGKGAGDEITGWIHKDDIAVLEVIAEWDGENFIAPSAKKPAGELRVMSAA